MAETLQQAALRIAITQLGVREVKANSGPEVDGYLYAVGLKPGYAWCTAFVYWCFMKAALELGIDNPVYRTAGVLMHWNQAKSRGAQLIKQAAALADPSIIKPGMIFVMEFGGGRGHTGIVESVDLTKWTVTSIEGNTDSVGSREGVEVARKTRRISSIKGFIDYSARDTGKLS
jgi:hypothetical protein